MILHRYFLVAALAAVPAAAQTPTPGKTTEQQARSYVASALITGAAPAVMSDKVLVSPALRERLGLAPDANGAAVYKGLMGLTAGKSVQVRRAAGDEIAQSQAPAAVSDQPIFAVEAGDVTLLVQYDLARDNISYVGLPGAVATAAPVMAPTAPTMVEAPKPVAAPALQREPVKPAQVVEPQIPRVAPRAATTPVAAVRPPQPVVTMEEKRPPLRKSGPCEIKPVMSDQDLVNCGATPR